MPLDASNTAHNILKKIKNLRYRRVTRSITKDTFGTLNWDYDMNCNLYY